MKCPVCSVLFERNSLRPVKFLYTGKEVQIGDILTMNLVVRPSQCINAFQPNISKLSHYLHHPIPLADAPDIEIRYCHLLYNSVSYEVSLLQQNLQELDECEKEMNAVGETYLLNTMQSIRQELLSRIHVLHSVSSSVGESVDSSLTTVTPWNQSGEGTLPSALENVCYYYTLPWRLSYHLLPLTFQCLRCCYGSYSQCPLVIQSRVIDVEQTEITVKHYSVDKSINHLPLYSVVRYVELDIKQITHQHVDKQLWEMVKKRESNRKAEKKQQKMEERRIYVFTLYMYEKF